MNTTVVGESTFVKFFTEKYTTCSKSVNIKPAKTEAVSKLIHSSSPKAKIRLLACHSSDQIVPNCFSSANEKVNKN